MPANGLDNTKTNYVQKVTGGTWQPVAVGTNGTIISGVSQNNSQTITVLLLAEGSVRGDPTYPDLATEIGRKQAAAVKVRLSD
ncbi:hypothetical protein AWC25_13530 [Mycobacterium sherrisii]|uniref:Uncharacterized protein n=2 Tax=Mycobacterium sherrisii TaxID=243061 RepID=A0A1E3SLK8_9MYCO|nr:hypothetical protein BHQ21_22040 [Mycobacterium sherrisii]ORW75617.1 hypothetical protein AWC25_13530 [Mycobacterium sherrisii]